MTEIVLVHGWGDMFRVSETRGVRVRPSQDCAPQSDGSVHVVDFEILNMSNSAWEPEIEGSVKWDGCSNWNDPGSAVHMCGPEEADTFAQCLRVAYALAAPILGETCDWDAPVLPTEWVETDLLEALEKHEASRDLQIAAMERQNRAEPMKGGAAGGASAAPLATNLLDGIAKHEASRDLGYEAAIEDVRKGINTLRGVEWATIGKVLDLLFSLEKAKK